jgi:hypothetical protein
MSEKEAGSVVTSENSADFYANRLGLADREVAEAVVEETPNEPVAETDQSEPAAEDDAKPTEEKKQNPKLERRFSEITKQREEARKEAQKEREQRQALEQRLAALEQQNRPPARNIDEEPQPSQFQDAFEYAKALAEFSTEKALAERDRRDAEEKLAVERQKVIQTWATKVQSAKSSMPDFDEVVASSDVVVNDDIRDAILESDVGPQILYHLAENDDLGKKIAGMSPKAALREIGKLEERFAAKPNAKTETVAKSKAPAPINPIRGGTSAADVPMGSDGEFHGTYAQWKAQRRTGKIK